MPSLYRWGFKLYEYRQQLLSPAGLTGFAVSSLFALGNVTRGPLLTHAIGLRSASADVVFAARSVTPAVSSPVMVML